MYSFKKSRLAKAVAAFVGFTAGAFMLAGAGVASAQTAEELQAQISSLLAQIATLQSQLGGQTGGTVTAKCSFTRDLTIGSQGADVTCLQTYLQGQGFYTFAGGATGYFGPITRDAVAAWQAANGVSPAAGYFGPISMAKYNMLVASTPAVEVCGDGIDNDGDALVDEGCTGGSTGSDSSDLQGGAGSVESFEEMSGISNEEVGEDEEDVVIAGIEVEAEGSDLMFTAVRLDFATQPGNDDLDEFITEVSIWVDGEEFARVDADEFDDDNNWTRTVTLEDGAIVREGDTGEITVAVSGVGNVDTDDAGDTWGLDFISVRYMDAQGVTITDNTDTDEFSWSVVDFATAANTELKVSSGDEEINDARIIDVHATDDTDDVEFLSFEIEIEGDSDVTVDEIPVLITTTEAAGTDFDEPGDVITGATLYMNGEKVGSESLSGASSGSADSQTVTFDDLDLTLDAGETYEFIVSLDLVSLADALDAGDSISVDMTSTEVDAIDAEDESGEEISDTDATGTASADAHTVYDAAFTFELLEAEAEVTTQGDPGTTGSTDRGTLTFRYELTAFGGDVSIDKSCVEAQTDTPDQGTEYTLENESGTETCSVTSTASTNPDDSDAWLIEEGETETFTVTISTTGNDAFVRAYLTSINWDDNTSDTDPDLYFTAGLGEDETATNSIFLETY